MKEKTNKKMSILDLGGIAKGRKVGKGKEREYTKKKVTERIVTEDHAIEAEGYQKAIENIDWDLLQRQKKRLEKLIVSEASGEKAIISDKDIYSLWGLIEFIEILQDAHENERLKRNRVLN